MTKAGGRQLHAWQKLPLKRALRPGGRSASLIKGDVSPEPAPGLVPGYSASGQDVWLEAPLYSDPGLIVSAVGARCGKVFEAAGSWGVVANTSVLLPQPGHDAHFLWYLTNNEDFWEKGGTAQPYVRVSETLERRLPIPPLGLQRTIADFLDTKTARIDALLTKKRRMIDVLDEHRRAFVAKAVTVRLDSRERPIETQHPFAPWIAPGWRLMRLRHVVREIVDTAHKTAPIVEGGEYLVVRTANVKSGRLVLDGAHYTDRDSWTEWTARGVPDPGDVIFTREAPAGEACLVPVGIPLCIGQRTVLLRPRHDLVSGAWLLNSLYSGPAQQFVEVLSRSTTVAHINMADIPDIPIVVPPLAEQESVLQRIAAVADRCEAITSRLSEQVQLLQEHRQALITAAVTGELEVPGVAA